MALQWTPLRPQPNVFSRVRQSVEHLEHQTQSNVLYTFKLMVSENGVPPGKADLPFSQLRSRKMTDRAVQCDPETDILAAVAPPMTNCIVAEINTAEPSVSVAQPVAVEFTNSLGRKKRTIFCENVDEIVVQPTNSDDKTETEAKKVVVTEVDGAKRKKQDSCCIDCLYLSMKCCECTIM